MFGFVSVVRMSFDAVAAYAAARLPARAEALETVTGFLLIGCFALIGSALPVVM
jgi:ABC-type branched-subunit amino acid transport system permease subunit